MKRLWLGLLLLCLLLAGSALIGRRARILCAAPVRLLEQAAEGAAPVPFRAAERAWQAHRAELTVFADHDPLEQADGLFAQAGILFEAGYPAQAAAVCAKLAALLEAIAEAQQLSWQNLM